MAPWQGKLACLKSTTHISIFCVPGNVDAKTGYTVKFAANEHSSLWQLCPKEGVSLKKTSRKRSLRSCHSRTLTTTHRIFYERFPPCNKGADVALEATHCMVHSFLLGSMFEETVHCYRNGTAEVSAFTPEW